MPKTNDIGLINFIKAYNESWYSKDIEKVKSFYSDVNDELVYFDNHKNNDTYSVDEHLKLLSEFFRHGKNTESGQVEELLMENINCFQSDNSACVCFYGRYKSFPKPAIRSTLYLEKNDNEWKIKHAHYSFEPEK
jgi:ketosteroid isomerase-like protein